MRAMLIAAAVVLDAQDRGAAGQHFVHRLHFDLPQPAGLQQSCPAAVGPGQILQRAKFEASGPAETDAGVLAGDPDYCCSRAACSWAVMRRLSA
ncbi:hypothetical protein [Pseudomonas asuensis]|uniref:hypothetical protein n=1 Tax=Pseudomonas asuensis TaxID=1825787 RepID=UPI001E5B781D|nr:hypothetical protein [Pseudomonas asuensis]